MKDRVMQGAIAGVVGNIVMESLSWVFHWLGYLKYTTTHIAAGFFLPLERVSEPLSLLLGAVTDYTVAITFGVALSFFLRFTGDDFAVFKGIGFGLVFFVAVYGTLVTGGITSTSLATPLPNLLLGLQHAVFGAVTGWVLDRYIRHTPAV